MPSLFKRIPIVNLLFDAHERIIHIEQKIDDLARVAAKPVEPVSPQYQGSTDQTFGHISYAQCGEDMILVNIFALLGINRPTYIDIGGHMPWVGSNTALLYTRGSSGIIVEPNPDLIDPFKTERPRDVTLNVGVSAKSGTLPFYRIDPWSGRNTFSKQTVDEFVAIHPEYSVYDVINVDVMTLDSIISAHCGGAYPDFLSIDAEGEDFKILESADFSKSKPKVICVEIITGGDVVSIGDLSALLKTRGYFPYARTWGNAFFLSADTADRLAF